MSARLHQGESCPSGKSRRRTKGCHDRDEGTPTAFRHRPQEPQCIHLHNQCGERLWHSRVQEEPTACVRLDTTMLGQYDDGRELHPMHEGHWHIQWAPCYHHIMEDLTHSGFSRMHGDCPIYLAHDHSRPLDHNHCWEA